MKGTGDGARIPNKGACQREETISRREMVRRESAAKIPPPVTLAINVFVYPKLQFSVVAPKTNLTPRFRPFLYSSHVGINKLQNEHKVRLFLTCGINKLQNEHRVRLFIPFRPLAFVFTSSSNLTPIRSQCRPYSPTLSCPVL